MMMASVQPAVFIKLKAQTNAIQEKVNKKTNINKKNTCSKKKKKSRHIHCNLSNATHI
jgi:hypothetical protein